MTTAEFLATTAPAERLLHLAINRLFRPCFDAENQHFQVQQAADAARHAAVLLDGLAKSLAPPPPPPTCTNCRKLLPCRCPSLF